MRNEKSLVTFLKKLSLLIIEEADRNPSFAQRVEELMLEIPSGKPETPKRLASGDPTIAPDIYAAWKERGEIDFKLWLSQMTLPVLKVIISNNDFDPTRRTSKWREPEKLALFIVDALKARLSRGSSFLG